MKIENKRILCCVLSLMMIFLMGGCGNAATEEVVEATEPISAMPVYE